MTQDWISEEESPPFVKILTREAKQASVYAFSTFITQFGSFLVVPLFWKKLSLSDYGIISLTEIVGSFLVMFLGISLDTSITRFYYEWPEKERRRRVGTLWMLNWMSCILIGVLSILLFSLISHAIFPEVAFYPFIFLGLLNTIARSLMVVPYATIRIAHLPWLYTVYSLVSFSVSMFLNIYFVFILDKHLYGYFTSNIIGSCVTVLLGGAIMLRFAVPCIQLAGLRESLRFSLPSIPTSVLSGITQVLDRFLLQRFASLEVLGIYTVSLKFTNLILYLHNALKMSFVPFMVKAISKNRVQGILQLTRIRLFYLFPILMFGITISAYIKDFVQLAGQSEYYQIAQWVPWLIGPALISTFTIYFAPGLFLAKRTDLTWIPQVSQLGAVLVGGLLLIPKFQLVGVIISRYISILSLFVVNFILSQRYFPLPVKWTKMIIMLSLVVLGIGLSLQIEFNHLGANILSKAVVIGGIAITCLMIIVGPSNTKHLLNKQILKNWR